MIAARRIPQEIYAPAPPVVTLLRIAALECRTAARRPLEACAVVDPDAKLEDCLVSLIQALHGATDRRMVFWQPGAAGLSFDETWLLAVAAAIARGDGDSLRFLIARRVRAHAAPIVGLLIQRLVSAFPGSIVDF